jgi:hypothetical protein
VFKRMSVIGFAAALVFTLTVPAQALVNQDQPAEIIVRNSINAAHGSIDCASQGGCTITVMDNGDWSVATGNGNGYLVDTSGNIYGAP